MRWITHEDAYDVMGGEEFMDFLGYTIRIHGERSFTEEVPDRRHGRLVGSHDETFYEDFDVTGTVVGEIYEPRTVCDILGVRTVHDYGVVVRTEDGEIIRLTDGEMSGMTVEYLLPQSA